MIGPDRRGHIDCHHCGHHHHFYGPCQPVPPGGAVLEPPRVVVGCVTATEARAAADAARTAASGAVRPRTPHGDREWGGS